jgi:predicted transcriptional regulator
MEVHVTPELAKKLNDLAATTGRRPDELVQDALAGYLEELASLRDTLEDRYDDLQTGRVQPVDAQDAFTRLREQSENRRSRGA